MASSKNAHRRLLYVSVAGICKDSGFDGASKTSLESLTEMLQAHLTELTRSCRKYCELSHRTTPDFTDVKMALAEVGASAHGLHLYSKRIREPAPKNITLIKAPVEHKTLKTALSKLNQPSYIPTHFPDYPDVHAFVRTPTLREPVNQYQTVRERVAAQRESTEYSLVKYLSHTDPSNVSIFENINTEEFPSSAIVTDSYPYLKGLIPSQNDVLDLDSNDDRNTSSDDLIENSQSSENSQVSSTNSSINLVTNSKTENPYIREPKRLKLKK